MSDVAPDTAGGLRHLYLIDGSGFVFRAFHALPPLTRPDGTPVNAVLGFTNMLWKILRETDADHAAVIFDSGRHTFRNELFEQYKANRGETPEELIPQFPLVREAAGAFNLASVELAGFEADDLIAAYADAARARGARVTIVSADKDLMQLVDADSVMMYDYFKNREIGPEQVRERFGVGPERVIDVQALAGDSSDNVPGVPGIGVKTAAQLINDYGDLDRLLEHAEEIKQPKRRQNLIEHAGMARLSRTLVTLRRDTPLPLPLEALARKAPEPGALRAFLADNGFKSIAARVAAQDGEAAPADTEEAAETAPLPASYPLVTEAAALADWVEAARRSGVLALAPFTAAGAPEGSGIVGLALATAPGAACYVPLGHAGPDLIGAEEPVRQMSLAEALGVLDPVLGDPGILKLGLDIKRTLRLLARQGFTLAPVDDPMLASWVLDGSLHGHGLEDLSRLHLDRAAPALAELLGSGRGRVAIEAVSPAALRDTAAAHADLALRLHGVIRPRLVTDRLTTVYERIERPLIPVLARMEAAGILVDQGELVALSQDFAGRIETLEREIHALAGRPFTIGSPKQLGEVLFDEMGLASGRKGKSGAYSTGADILEELAAQGHDLPARVLDWRQLTKLKSTYTDALIEPHRPRDTAGAHDLRHDRRQHRAAVVQRPQPAEHPDPQRGGPPHPPRLRGRAGPCAALGRLFADRASHPRPCRRRRAAQAGLPRRDRHPRADREPGVRPAAGGDGPDGPPLGQGDQFRDHLRHQPLRARAPDRRAAGRGQGLYRGLFRALSRHQGLYGEHQEGGPCGGLRHHAVRAQVPAAGDQRPQPGAPGVLRAGGDQRADPGGRGRRHQARDDPATGRAGRKRPARPDAAPGARRAGVRSARGGSR